MVTRHPLLLCPSGGRLHFIEEKIGTSSHSRVMQKEDHHDCSPAVLMMSCLLDLLWKDKV
jgi:hypothetical protein